MPNRNDRPWLSARRSDALDPFGDHRRRLAPREVDVDPASGDRLSGGGRAAEVDVRSRSRYRASRGAGDPVVITGEVERIVIP